MVGGGGEREMRKGKEAGSELDVCVGGGGISTLITAKQ